MNRILIVDDKDENIYYLHTLLTGHGFTVDSARHGAEALVKARQAPPDLVISDLLMPVMDGYTLLRHWKTDTRLKHVPFIVYTATYTEPEDERLALDLGADAFILKPAEPEDFLARLREVKANAATTAPVPPKHPVGDELGLLEVYSQTLIRKLEEKTLQLEAANRTLQHDITERERAEKELNKYRNHLEELVKERTAELRQAQDKTEAAYRKLVELEKLRDDLVHMVVHDMRSPLAGLVMFLELLSPEEVSEPDFKENLRMMREASHGLSDMVTSLLDISRLEAGQMPLQCKTSDLEQLTRAALQRLSGLAQGRHIAVRAFVSPVLAYCDPIITERILQNLLGNALKFTPTSGSVRIELVAEVFWARFSITDTGPGIPVEYHEKVFEKFGQVEMRQDHKVPSSGLGLAFCKLAVEGQGGSILLESEPGRGTTFHVRLPRHAPGKSWGNAA